MSRVRAPELPQHFPWLNCQGSLSLKELKGRVVLLDFWTYCCINCLHILPDLKYFEQKYKDCLTVIGVHSAKFNNEQEIENIRQAILRYDIEHPVVVDQNYEIWQQYAVKAWPTLVIIDPQGYYVGSAAGEGNREPLDEILETLIQAHQEKNTLQFSEINLILEKQKQPLITPLAFPGKVLADATNNCLFIADSGHHRIVMSSLAGEILQIIGTGKPGFKDGSFDQAQFSSPQGMTFDSETQILYVADTDNHLIRQIDFNTQTVTTLAGTGEQSDRLEPHSSLGLETALNSPWDLEKVGNQLFIAMAGSHQIWSLNLDTKIMKTYAGRGAESNVDGALLEAAFAQPSGISTDGKELFIADSEISTIRGVGLGENAIARTISGSGGLFDFGDEDGEGYDVRLQHCLGVEYSGNDLWVADTYNHKIKKIDTQTGRCETVFGEGKPGNTDGTGKNTRFFEPSGLSALSSAQPKANASFLYIADTNNHAIRQANLETLDVKTIQFQGLCSPEVCIPSE